VQIVPKARVRRDAVDGSPDEVVKVKAAAHLQVAFIERIEVDAHTQEAVLLTGGVEQCTRRGRRQPQLLAQFGDLTPHLGRLAQPGLLHTARLAAILRQETGPPGPVRGLPRAGGPAEEAVGLPVVDDGQRVVDAGQIPPPPQDVRGQFVQSADAEAHRRHVLRSENGADALADVGHGRVLHRDDQDLALRAYAPFQDQASSEQRESQRLATAGNGGDRHPAVAVLQDALLLRPQPVSVENLSE